MFLQIRKIFKNIFIRLRDIFIELYLKMLTEKKKFEIIYKYSYWRSNKSESVSGYGSSIAATKILLENLENFIKKIFDAPCGDFFWIKKLNFENIDYLGGDIVVDLIKENKQNNTMGKGTDHGGLFKARLTQAINDILLVPSGFTISFSSNLSIGFVLIIITSLVILGGLKRISLVATRLVPFMVTIYMFCVIIILIINIEVLPTYLKMIFTDAFVAENYNGEQVYGGVLGALIILGIRRGAFSNEAGIGSSPIAHAAGKTKEAAPAPVAFTVLTWSAGKATPAPADTAA